MDNYSFPLTKCICAKCGNIFYCITPTWWCKECYEIQLRTMQKGFEEWKEKNKR